MTTPQPWDVDRYHRFAGPREQPGLDLIGRLGPIPEGPIADLGCGEGRLTLRLAERYPGTQIRGIDSSADMLRRARSLTPAIEWVNGDIAEWQPPSPLSLIFSNAALHWLPNHRELFPALLRNLIPGGCLAVQMPLSWAQPSHQLMRDCLTGPGNPLGPTALHQRLGQPSVHEPGFYYHLLHSLCPQIEIWTTEYLHVLEGEDTVLEWVSSTGLRPVLESLTPAELSDFMERYRPALRSAYPQQEGLTLFPFRRIFILATAGT